MSDPCEEVCEFLPLSARSNSTPKQVFLRLITPSIVEHIAAATTDTRQGKRKGPRGPVCVTTAEDVLCLIHLLVGVCAEQTKSLPEYVRAEPTLRSVYEQVRGSLTFDVETLFGLFNKNLKATVRVGGHGVVDESIWEWTAKNEFVRDIPRKPKDEGLVLYCYCFTLTRSGRPVLWHLIPDIQHPVLTPEQVISAMVQVWPEDTAASLTTDCLFTHLGWLINHADLPITAAMAQNDIGKLWPLLTYQLKYHEYRQFYLDLLLLTFWKDNAVVATATTAFKPNTTELGLEGTIRGQNLSGLKPVLSLNGAIQLSTSLSLEDLKALAYRCGCSSCTLLLIFCFLFANKRCISQQEPGKLLHLG
jgi:hypothetical protein